MARRLLLGSAIALGVTLIASPAFACGGLIGPNGAVNLGRTTTLAAYHNGIEHYVTAFTFTGATKGQFGSIVPLPGIPTKVERGGDWTLQRLEKEVAPPVPKGLFFGPSDTVEAAPAQVILQTKIDALDITVLKGGAFAVGKWAEDHGFNLPPDAPAVLDFYARRSEIFMAARFDAAAALKRGQREGDGTPIHLTIPTKNPWVPLRILALGKHTGEVVDADVFLLTDAKPAMLPAPLGAPNVAGGPIAPGLQLVRSERASGSLMKDLSIDQGMGWMPPSMWLTFIRVNTPAQSLGYDLAIDTSGHNKPSYVAAGFEGVRAAARSILDSLPMWLAMVAAGAMTGGILTTLLRRRVRPA